MKTRRLARGMEDGGWAGSVCFFVVDSLLRKGSGRRRQSYSNSNSKRSLRWPFGFAQDRLVEGSSTYYSSYASVTFFLAALILSLM
jgi:hypothetical protein